MLYIKERLVRLEIEVELQVSYNLGDGDTFLNLNQRREKMDTHNMEERLHWYRW